MQRNAWQKKEAEEEKGAWESKTDEERIKAKESYYQKISNGLTDQIQQLENQVISADSKFNERDEFWKEKYGI